MDNFVGRRFNDLFFSIGAGGIIHPKDTRTTGSTK